MIDLSLIHLNTQNNQTISYWAGVGLEPSYREYPDEIVTGGNYVFAQGI